MTRIHWTHEERALVTNTLVSYLKSNNQTSDHVTRPGWFAFYMQQAQMFLPADRKRLIFAPSVAPWLLQSVRISLGEAPTPDAVEPTDISAFVRANLEAVISELTKTHIVVERSVCVPRQVVKPKSQRTQQLRVLVAGLLPAQAAELSAKWGAQMDLRFWYSNESAGSGTMPTVDYVIGIVSFLSHSLDAKLNNHFKARYHRVIGAMGSVNQILQNISVHGKAIPA